MALTQFSFPTAITFGPGARREVAAHLKQRGVKCPLIVTDKGLAELPILKEFVASLTGLPVKVYSGVFGNPVKQQVADGVKAFKDHKADAVIGFGGVDRVVVRARDPAPRAARTRRRACGARAGARRRRASARAGQTPRALPATAR